MSSEGRKVLASEAEEKSSLSFNVPNNRELINLVLECLPVVQTPGDPEELCSLGPHKPVKLSSSTKK